jgi:SAM-dependent methyltransferase
VAYILRYNHLWYQTMVDLSPQFMREHPTAEPNRSVRDYYEFPYRLVSQPGTVLVVGAGTGNDVAAALRHGARHVDAVEIDPVILDLGRRYHPEHPYASLNVNTYVDDARAFFHKTKRKYDLIVFGFLDSSTLLTGFSSLRLDNYVYTRESFESARRLLKPGGSMVLAFAVTRSFAADRLFVTLTQAFNGIEPRAFPTRTNVEGMVYIEGAARENAGAANVAEATATLHRSSPNAIAASDNWPFLYLEARTIPVSLQVVLAVFVLAAWLWQRNNVRSQFDMRGAEFFLLGAGFLLLETNAVTRLALLFGSTWVVNIAVISAFLFMALVANALVERTRVNTRWCYLALLLVVFSGTALPYFGRIAPVLAGRVVLTTLWTALPVFFSGLIFSSALQKSNSPAHALAMNLLGAVIGGVLENAVMIGGSVLVGVLACAVYACAWASSIAARPVQQETFGGVISDQPESTVID